MDIPSGPDPRHPGLLGPGDDGFGGLLVNILLEDLALTVAIRPKEYGTAVAGPSRREIIALIEGQPPRRSRQLGASPLQFGDVNIGLKIRFQEREAFPVGGARWRGEGKPHPVRDPGRLVLKSSGPGIQLDLPEVGIVRIGRRFGKRENQPAVWCPPESLGVWQRLAPVNITTGGPRCRSRSSRVHSRASATS